MSMETPASATNNDASSCPGNLTFGVSWTMSSIKPVRNMTVKPMSSTG